MRARQPMSRIPTREHPLIVGVVGLGAIGRRVCQALAEHDEEVARATLDPLEVGVGVDDLFHTDKVKWTLQLTAVNITNEVALYNFLSTFSGTHFVTPRSYSAELGFHF